MPINIRKSIKTNEVTTFYFLRTDPRIAPYLQKHPKGFPGPSQDAPRDAPPIWCPLVTPQGRPGTPQGRPGNPPGRPGPPQGRPGTPQGPPRDVLQLKIR